jgi:hypothetical protein
MKASDGREPKTAVKMDYNKKSRGGSEAKIAPSANHYRALVK